jgi:predicted phosphodiesterase
LEASKPAKPFPIKIGLLADSQITSQNGFSDFHFRSKSADKMVDVSIRPPALERVLAKEMLQISLNKLTQDSHGKTRGVDIILYLGDAANSGGTDEIETVLAILAKHREQTGVPVFIIIGNHDYLGAGNISSPGIRFAMLNQVGRPDNPALTKYEVLKKFSEFNHANNRLAGNNRFRYVDNADALKRNKNLDHDTGLYLSGVVTYTEAEKGRVDIFLLDSSDYKDAPDWSAVAGLGFYGVIGSVSFKDEPEFVSQTSYLKQFALSSQPDFRFLASHYPKDHLDRITVLKPGQVPLNVTNLAYDVTESAFNIPTFSKTLNQNLEPLLSAGGGNYWVSGHTHVPTMPRPGRFIVGGLNAEKYFNALNVGSTTDYRAHVAIVEHYQSGRNQRLDNFIGYREIPLSDCDESLLVPIPEAIGTYGRKHADDPLFEPLIPSLIEWNNEAEERAARSRDLMDLPSLLLGVFLKKQETDKEKVYWIDVGATILGINKSYQQDGWTDLQTEASDQHLRNFVNEFVDRTGSNRADVISYLGLLSGAYENGLLPVKCDFGPECLKRLCTDPPSPAFSKLPRVKLPLP